MFEKKIVVEHGCLCGDSLKDFPLPVSLVDPDLRSTENGGRGCGPGGEDILFSDPETGGILDREIENYDPAVGRLKAWVRIPSFSSGGNTILSLSCGEPAQARTNRPAAVWDDDYRLVIHDASAESPRDSSSHANDVRAEETAEGERWTRVADADAVHVTEALTVEAWVDSPEARTEAVESLISKWASSARFDAFDAFDAGTTGGLDSKGFLGTAFDGRYVYFPPQANATLGGNGTRRHGVVLRYDTHGDFKAPESWQAYDAGHTDGLNTKGYYGGVFDGRYVYFVPRYDGTNYHSRVLRYDTLRNFTDSASWSAYDAGLPVSYQSAGYDGRYIYLCPGHRPDAGELAHGKSRYNTATSENGSGEILRYDTRGEFKDSTSWAVYDAAGTSDLNTCYFDGAVFDGTYMYFVPLCLPKTPPPFHRTA